MHWHEDLQFILVLDGTIEVQTLDSSSVFPRRPPQSIPSRPQKSATSRSGRGAPKYRLFLDHLGHGRVLAHALDAVFAAFLAA